MPLALALGEPLGIPVETAAVRAEGRQRGLGRQGDEEVKALGAAPSLEKSDFERKGEKQRRQQVRHKGLQNREDLLCLWKGRRQKERRLMMPDELIF